MPQTDIHLYSTQERDTRVCEAMFGTWDDIVEDYTTGSLSFSKDKLAAVEDIAHGLITPSFCHISQACWQSISLLS